MGEPGFKKQDLIYRAGGRPECIVHLGPYAIEPLIDREEEHSGTVYRVHIAADRQTGTSYHRLAEEYYYVLAGSGTAFVNAVPYSLVPGSFLRLPPGAKHSFLAGEHGLEMLDIHTPGCWTDRDTYFDDAVPPGFSDEGPFNK